MGKISDCRGLRLPERGFRLFRSWLRPLGLIAVSSIAVFAQPITPIVVVHRQLDRNLGFGSEVTVEGVVTQYATGPWGMTIQDSTDGIYIETDGRKGLTEVAVGDHVVVSGKIDPGEFAPIVMAESLRVTGHSPLPRPHLVENSELSGGALDNQFVEIRGMVEAATAPVPFIATRHVADLLLDIQDRNLGSAHIALTDIPADPLQYVDAPVVARGVAFVIYNRKRQATGLRVVVTRKEDIRLLRHPAAGPFSIEPTPIAKIMKWNAGKDWSRRVRVSGVLTLARPGEFAILQDGNSAIRVETESRENIPPGSRVEAAGFVSADTYSPQLRNSVIRVVGQGPGIAPLARAAQELMKGDADDLLVTTTATVIDIGRAGRRVMLTLEGGNFQFDADAPGNSWQALQNIRPGARIELTGICQVTAHARGAPQSVEILLRDANDVRVLDSGPTLTTERIAWGGGIVAGAALLCGLWALTLRRRVRAQTEWIQTSLEREHWTARLMAKRSAILERVGRNELLNVILSEIVSLANAHIPNAGVAIRVTGDGEPRVIGAAVENAEPAAAVTAASNSSRIRATVSLTRKPASERENEALHVCRECLALALDHRDLHDRLIEQSMSDPLTRLPNRRLLEERFRHALEEARDEKQPLAVFALDLDSFKEINDTFGHAAGDAVLRELAERFNRVMRRSDLLARVGGDEFVALLPRIGDRRTAMDIAGRLAAAASSPIEVNGVRLTASVSIGAAFYPEDGDDAEALRHAADIRMYEHKMDPARREREIGAEPMQVAIPA